MIISAFLTVRDIFDLIKEGGASELAHGLDLPQTLLRIGRGWIHLHDLEQADWFIANARQLHAAWTDRFKQDVDLNLQRASAHLLCDILLSSFELAVAGDHKVSFEMVRSLT